MPVAHGFKSWLVGKALAGMGVDKKFPKVVKGAGCATNSAQVVKDLGITKPLVVTDSDLVKLGLVDVVLDSLRAADVPFELYSEVTPDPTITQIEKGASIYNQGGCDGLLAFGGGSSMDCAKVIGCAVAHPKSTVADFRLPGVIKKDIPPLICVPTTAGTGSETTLAAVVRDDVQEFKFTVVGLQIMPKVAILDPELMRNLPKHITAATGMDAMTHAVEAYVGTWASPGSMEYSEDAVKRLCKYLVRAYDDGNDMEARQEVMQAAYSGGCAISLASVGYVHAIAHNFGARFHTPHGVANAMVMPYVLDFYVEGVGSLATERLANLAVLVGLGSKDSTSDLVLAKLFISKLREMNAAMNMTTTVDGMKRNDVQSIATRALYEAHGQLNSPFTQPLSWFMDPGYPVPRYLDQSGCEAIVSKFVDGNSMRAKM